MASLKGGRREKVQWNQARSVLKKKGGEEVTECRTAKQSETIDFMVWVRLSPWDGFLCKSRCCYLLVRGSRTGRDIFTLSHSFAVLMVTCELVILSTFLQNSHAQFAGKHPPAPSHTHAHALIHVQPRLSCCSTAPNPHSPPAIYSTVRDPTQNWEESRACFCNVSLTH